MVLAHEPHDATVWHPELLAASLRDRRLTLLVGAPGPLRDGMLRRALQPLQAAALPQPPLRVVRFDAWGLLPLPALRMHIDQAFEQPTGEAESLADQLRDIGEQHQATVLLVLDGFERHLNQAVDRPGLARFDAELARCIADRTVPLHVLMVVDSEPLVQQRYAQVPRIGGDVFRLQPQPDEAVPWSDTDIEEALLPDARDDATSPAAEAALDLPLEELPPPVAVPAAPAPARVQPAMFAMPTASVPTTAPWRTQAEPPAPVASPRSTAQAIPPMPAAEPVLPPVPAASTASLTAPPRAPVPAGTPAWTAWRTEADPDTLRRLQPPARRWPARLGFALYLVVLMAGAWWAARWILDMPREPRPQATAGTPRVNAADQAAPDRRATSGQAVNGAAPNAEGAAAGSSTRSRAVATAGAIGTSAATDGVPGAAPSAAPAITSARTLALSVPSDAGSLTTLAAERIRRVAAAAGLDVRVAAGGESAALVPTRGDAAPPTRSDALLLMRGDALLAARGSTAVPLQVVAPLYDEQVQVLVRTDARWDYVHEIRDLRLNIGQANGPRARTVQALYRELFGAPLARAQTDALDLDAALRRLQQRGSGIDAVVAVSHESVVLTLPAIARRQVRELSLDARRAGSMGALPAFAISRRAPDERARLAVTTFLVASGAPSPARDGALRDLAVALCRAPPTAAERDSPLLYGTRAGAQPYVGWPHVLPRRSGGACALP